ncbi:MAG: NirD/YgiW/YdeI family stress tolerance protein [Deltaproteobacteria bacterium]|jgi:uncharacterized protein (TIGR00156 family)|nr:NirD/YgiW/YdeI family stress tolerance protein [Deltaproteobacteria bacterium]
MRAITGLLSSSVLVFVIFAFSGILNAQEGFQSGAPPQPAAPGAQGGFQGPGLSATTVAEALTLRDDSPVILQGNIVRSVGNEKYILKDSTGEITVDIDDKLWAGRTVNPETKVEIHGEIDREFIGGIVVDADRLNTLN